MSDVPTILLRLTAFLVDSLAWAVGLMLPAAALSYLTIWLGGGIGAMNAVWGAALLIFVLSILLRDGWRGRSAGKRLLGLTLVTPDGSRCGYGRSLLRNLPLVVPLWNLVEVVLIVTGRPRTGDLIAATSVVQE
jgi:uncharacterized RDD family membrane protein YckC